MPPILPILILQILNLALQVTMANLTAGHNHTVVHLSTGTVCRRNI